MIIAACESSCDETDLCLFDSEKRTVIARSLFSQISLHESFGGVVPEIASRTHLEKIDLLFSHLLEQSPVPITAIDMYAATNGPGLSSALLIGTQFMKSIAWATKKPFMPVNHLKGHIYSSCIETDIPFPHLTLSASGGHTALYLVNDYTSFTLLGKTTDDAAGECFDKIASLIGLPYPGGPQIEHSAAQYQGERGKKRYPGLKDKHSYNFSFSGLKTAVLYDLVKRGYYDLAEGRLLKNIPPMVQEEISYELQSAISTIFCDKVQKALSNHPVMALTFVGGVASNEYLFSHLTAVAKKYHIPCVRSKKAYCTDNAAMIAFVAWQQQQHQQELIGYHHGVFPS